MSGMIRYPYSAELTEFRFPDRVQDRLHRNDVLKRYQGFNENIKLGRLAERNGKWYLLGKGLGIF